MRLAYKYRAYPTPATIKWLNKARYLEAMLFNGLVEYAHYSFQKRREAESLGLLKPKASRQEIDSLPQPLKDLTRGVRYMGLTYLIPAVKKEFPEMTSYPSGVWLRVCERVDRAFSSWFKEIKSGKNKNKSTGHPRLAKFNNVSSVMFDSKGYTLQDGVVLFTKNKTVVAKIKLAYDRPIQGKIKTMTVSCDKVNKWWVSFSCEDVPQPDQELTGRAIGIDVGLKNIIADSDGRIVKNPNFKILRKPNGKVDNLAKSISIKQAKLDAFKNSFKHEARSAEKIIKYKRCDRIRRGINRHYAKISNIRSDWANKEALYYATNYDVIVMEKLQISGSMVKKKPLDKLQETNGTRRAEKLNHRSVTQAGWYQLKSSIKNAAARLGKTFIEVNPANTTKKCSHCGNISKKPIPLDQRVYTCSGCGLEIDRDINAAINIKRRGMESIRTSQQVA